MGLLIQVPPVAHETQRSADLTLKIHKTSRILIVCEKDSDTDRLEAIFRQAGLTSENANNIREGCEAARSGRFGVVFSTPRPGNGSWTRLIEVASQHGLGFEIVLLACDFDLNQWGEAMQLGAFDVLDVGRDLPRAAEVARRALGAAHLRRFRPTRFSASC